MTSSTRAYELSLPGIRIASPSGRYAFSSTSCRTSAGVSFRSPLASTAVVGTVALNIPPTTNINGAQALAIAGVQLNLSGATQFGANFAVTDPPLKLVLIENPGKGGTLNLPNDGQYNVAHLRDSDIRSLTHKHMDYAVVEAQQIQALPIAIPCSESARVTAYPR